MFIVIFSLGSNNAEAINTEDISKKQNEQLVQFENELEKQGLTSDSFFAGASYYFNTQNQLVIQVAKSANTKVRELSRNLTFNNESKNNKVNDFIIEYVNYSEKELINEMEDFFKANFDISFSENTSLSLNTEINKLVLRTDNLDSHLLDRLQRKYGEMLEIEVDDDFANNLMPAKSRKADYNNLGSGIGIKSAVGECTTSGVLYKGNDYFLATAYHCLSGLSNLNLVRQWNAPIGVPHFNAKPTNYDFGLVKITQVGLTGGRYASNGLKFSDTTAGYDATIRNAGRPVQNQLVCKSGITQGYQCGIITSTKMITGPNRDIVIKVDKYGGAYLVGQGDSGGPLFDQTSNNLIGILSLLEGEYQDPNTGIWYGHTAYYTPFLEVAQKYGLYLYTADTARKLTN